MNNKNIGFMRYLNQTTWWWIPIAINSFFIWCAISLLQTIILLFIFNAPWILIKFIIWNFQKKSYADIYPQFSYKVNWRILIPTFFISILLAYFLVHSADVRSFLNVQVAQAKQYDSQANDQDIRDALMMTNATIGLPDKLFLSPFGFITFFCVSLVYWWRSYTLLSHFLIKKYPPNSDLPDT